jgi:DNA polymerase III epsilon subunit-like protein
VVIVDLETTGFSPTNDRVIQLAAMVLPFTGVEVPDDMFTQDQFNAFVRPVGASISPTIERLTGISQSFVEEEGMEFREAWALFMEWTRALEGDGGTVLLAHNGRSFDFNFLQAELRRCGHDHSLSEEVDVLVDTLHVLRDPSLWEGVLKAPKSFSLGSLYSHVTKAEALNSHNALFDVMALAKVLEDPELRMQWRRVANRKQFNMAAWGE